MSESISFSGKINVSVNGFNQSPAFEGQSDAFLHTVTTINSKIKVDFMANKSFAVLEPYIRIDSSDQNKNSIDIRTASFSRTWEKMHIKMGIDKVFWGKMEAHNLVDIINQSDEIANAGRNQKEKYGQPMVNIGYRSSFGKVDVFWLPWLRERKYPGIKGRLRTEWLVDNDNPIKQGNPLADFALRYENSVGAWDMGFSYFNGTSREPRLIPNVGNTTLIPHYDKINRAGLDIQYTTENAILKTEAILEQGNVDSFYAYSVGWEYPVYGIQNTDSDFTMLGEYYYDNRNPNAPKTIFQNDLFIGTRLEFNDVGSTTFEAGVIYDLIVNEKIFSAKLTKRMNSTLVLEAGFINYLDIDEEGTLGSFSNDSYFYLDTRIHF